MSYESKWKALFIARVLLGLAIFAALSLGLARSVYTDQHFLHSLHAAKVELTDVQPHNGGTDRLDLTFTVQNRWLETLQGVEVQMEVSDKSGKSLGTYTATFSGTDRTWLDLKPFEKRSETLVLSADGNDPAYRAMAEGGLENVRVTCRVTAIQWSDGSVTR